MSAYIEQVDAYVDELNAIRDAVAALAREERDRTSHRAYLMQARTLRDMLGKAYSLYSAAGVQARRECISDEATVVHYYMEMLSDYLSGHEARTAADIEEGDDEVVRLFARRHHEMTAGFCRRHATAFAEYARELDPNLSGLHP